MRTETKYYHELEDGREVELPFNTEHAYIEEIQTADKIIIGCIVRDPDPSDPLEELDEGILVQFDRHRIHDGERGGYAGGHRATIKNSEDIEDADGYYIAPEDLKPGKQAANYQAGGRRPLNSARRKQLPAVPL